MPATTYRWKLRDAQVPHIRWARHTFGPDASTGEHGHDFTEWFWIESGCFRHVTAAGEELLRRGDARFLTPGVAHALTAVELSRVVTVSVPAPAFRGFARRHRAAAGWPWPSRGSAARRLDGEQMAELSAALGILAGPDQETCDQEWFLTRLLQILRRPSSERPPPPAWLERALTALTRAERCPGSVADLIAACRRSAVHVNRTARRCHGRSATALVLGIRLDRAAGALRSSPAPVIAIAADCGFPTLGHFYRVFRARFGCSPAAYRSKAHDAAGSGDLPLAT